MFPKKLLQIYTWRQSFLFAWRALKVHLVSLQSTETTFMFVEEASVQQDVMWAADRVRAEVLHLAMHAVNAWGSSQRLTVNLAWQQHHRRLGS